MNKFVVGLIGVMGFLVAVNLGMISMEPGTETGETRIVSVEELMANLPIAEKEPETIEEPVIEEPGDIIVEEEAQPLPEPVPETEPVPEPEPVVSAPALVPPQTHTVSIAEGSGVPGCEETDKCYIPFLLEIYVGDTVVWNNDDSAAHTVTSGNPSDGIDGVFDSGLFMSDNSFEFTFDNPGNFAYFCMVHPWMVGEVIVSEVEEAIVVELDTEIIIEEKPPLEEPEKEAEPEEVGAAIVRVSVPQGTSVPGCEETNECFIPGSVSIRAGDTVSWSNDDSAAHTVTSGVPSPGPDGIFDSSLFMAGTTFEYTFAESGTYDYFCMVHPWMQGQVIVE